MLKRFIFSREVSSLRSRGFITLALLATLSTAGLLAVTAPVFPYLLGFHPNHLEPSFTHCSTPAPKIEPGKPIKVLNWNIQFLAGAYYPYWHHTFNQPLLTEEDLQKNLEGIVNVIREEKPDIIQLQEVHRTHPLTFHQDQLKMLHDKLSDILPCYGTGTYWKAHFIPSRHLTGQVEMSLVTMSRFRIDRAVTEVLPTTRRKRILVPFYPVTPFWKHAFHWQAVVFSPPSTPTWTHPPQAAGT